MDREELQRRAKLLAAKDEAERRAPAYVNTIAWLTYLGLLRHNQVAPRRVKVTLAEVLQAAQLEPRILELLPALMIALPQAIAAVTEAAVPEDLTAIIEQIKRRDARDAFRGVPPASYLRWLSSPALDVARKRLDFRRMPRRRERPTTALGALIRTERLRQAMTQAELAARHELPLRVIRDLEQGRLDAGVKTVNEILAVFGQELAPVARTSKSHR